MAVGWVELGLSAAVPGRPLLVTSSRMGHLLAALAYGCRVLWFEDATGGDGVFRQLVLVRITEPTSELNSGRVLEEAGVMRPAERCSRAWVIAGTSRKAGNTASESRTRIWRCWLSGGRRTCSRTSCRTLTCGS